MNDREFIAVFHYDNGGTNRCGAEPYRYAEEIVRCKECKHWNKSAMPTLQSPNVHPCLRAFSIMLSRADDFCSRGERREP